MGREEGRACGTRGGATATTPVRTRPTRCWRRRVRAMCRRTTQPLPFACPTPPGSPSPPATTASHDLDDDLPDDAADFDDDLLFDPLLSDEPIDLAAVRADDALIDALGGLGGLDSANDVVDPDDPLIAMLAAWAASARPETARPGTAAETTATGDAVPLLRSVPAIPADEPVGAPTTAIEPAARMDQPTVRLSAPAPSGDPRRRQPHRRARRQLCGPGCCSLRSDRSGDRPAVPRPCVAPPLPARWPAAPVGSPAAPGGGRRRRRGAGDQRSRSQRRYRRAGRPGMGDHQGVLRGAGAVDRGRSRSSTKAWSAPGSPSAVGSRSSPSRSSPPSPPRCRACVRRRATRSSSISSGCSRPSWR